MTRSLGRALVALVAALSVAGAGAPLFDQCVSPLEMAAQSPSCCGKTADARLEAPSRDCCGEVALGELEPTSSAGGASHDVPPAGVVTLPLTLLAWLGPTRDGEGSFRRVVERPPDRSPPTDTTVLLL